MSKMALMTENCFVWILVMQMKTNISMWLHYLGFIWTETYCICIHSDCWKWLLVHTFISDGYSRVGAETIRCKLHKEMSGGTNDSLIRKVFHLVRVVQNRGINVVAVFNQKPADINRTEVFSSVQNKESLNSICLADVTFPRFLVLSFWQFA